MPLCITLIYNIQAWSWATIASLFHCRQILILMFIYRRKLTVCPILEGEDQLRLLNYQHNMISKIQHLSSLKRLIFLDLYDNQIEEISGLSSLKSLRVLMLGKNRYWKRLKLLTDRVSSLLCWSLIINMCNDWIYMYLTFFFYLKVPIWNFILCWINVN